MSDLVPVVDLSGWFTGDAAARAAVAGAVDDACSRVGFLQVVGHGLADDAIAAMCDATEQFFRLPLDVKRRYVPPHVGVNRGYAAMGTEALSYSLGVAARPDLFEAFNIGEVDVPDDAWYRDPHDYFAPNVWPHEVPELRVALENYFREARRLAVTMTEIFSVALDLGEGWFRPHVERSTTTMRVVNYERRPDDPEPEAGQMRMGAHTDYGVVTVLYADRVPGLQIVTPDGSWSDVVPVEGAVVLNLGDLLARWTNDRWKSTIHRVVPPPADHGEARRRSVAFFFDADYDAVIECVPTCCSDDAPARYEPVVAGEHLMAKILGPRRFLPTDAKHDTARDRRAAVITEVP
jgi:isopenicillin N synthase-like dioxygenase